MNGRNMIKNMEKNQKSKWRDTFESYVEDVTIATLKLKFH